MLSLNDLVRANESGNEKVAAGVIVVIEIDEIVEAEAGVILAVGVDIVINIVNAMKDVMAVKKGIVTLEMVVRNVAADTIGVLRHKDHPMGNRKKKNLGSV